MEATYAGVIQRRKNALQATRVGRGFLRPAWATVYAARYQLHNLRSAGLYSAASRTPLVSSSPPFDLRTNIGLGCIDVARSRPELGGQGLLYASYAYLREMHGGMADAGHAKTNRFRPRSFLCRYQETICLEAKFPLWKPKFLIPPNASWAALPPGNVADRVDRPTGREPVTTFPSQLPLTTSLGQPIGQ